MLTHLAVCGACREVVALTASAIVSPPVEKTALREWNWRWAAALAAACVVGVVIWHSPAVPPPVVREPAKPVPAAEPAPKIETAKPAKALAAVPRPHVPSPLNLQQLATPSAAKPKAPAAAPLLAAPPAPSVDEIAQASQNAALTSGPVEAFKAAPQPMLPAPAAAPAMALRNLRPMPMKAFMVAARRPSLWRITSSSGQLEKSSDAGKTWMTIPVEGQANFWSLSVSGSDIWAGGEGGALFHSTDDGAQWKQVAVIAGEERLTEGITGIETRGSELRVKTESAKWVSLDGGVSWRKMAE